MTFTTIHRCKECSREYPLKPMNVCDFCFGPVEIQYDYAEIKKHVSTIKANIINL